MKPGSALAPNLYFPAPPRLPLRAWAALAVLTLAAAAALVQLQAQMTNQDSAAPDVFNLYVSGELPEVFNARPLMRWSIDGAQAIAFAMPGARSVGAHQINTGLQTLWMWAALAAIFVLARRVNGGRDVSWTAPFLAAIFVPWGFMRIGFGVSMPYDLPCIALSAAALAALVAGRCWIFGALVLAGATNKETIGWLIPAMVIFRWRGAATDLGANKRLLAQTAALAAAFFAVYFALRWSRAGGAHLTYSAIETTAQNANIQHSRWRLNVDEFLLRGDKRLFQNVYWPFILHLPALVFWRRLPRGLRRIYCAAPFFLVPIFFVGNMRELRLYNDLIPLGAASVVCIVASFHRQGAGGISRASVAAQYLKGEGIEIGALQNPMPLPPDARARYVDRLPLDKLREQYPELAHLDLTPPDVLDDGETLAKFPDASLDFIVACHFFEHCQNPLGALAAFMRALKPGGVAMLAVPEMTLTFDRDRPETSYEHVKRDYAEGPEASRRAHYEEWIRVSHKVDDPAWAADRVAHYMGIDYSIHFHCWTAAGLLDLLERAQTDADLAARLPYGIELFYRNGEETIFVLRRVEPSKSGPPRS